MAIKVMADSGGTVSYEAADIGAGFNAFANNKDFIIAGIDEEISVIYSAASLQIGINKGEAMICGRPVMINATEQFTLPANQSTELNLVLRVDLTQPIGQEGLITYVSDGQIKTDNLNNVNGQHDLVLAKFKTDANGVSSFTDKRVISDHTATDVIVDSALSSTSVNPVQNKVVKNALDGKANSSHTHGNIQNGGTLQSNDVTIANGDKLVVTDSSDSNKVARTSIAFDGSTTTQFLTKKGTWATPSGSGTQITQDTTFNISGTTFKITTA